MTLIEELEKLVCLENRGQRGRCFESFLSALLKEEGFHVTHNPACSPRLQVDLFARRAQTGFLVEAKWLGRPLSTAHILTVKERVRRTPQDVFACVFSISGYQEGAVREACSDRDIEIILFNELEIRRIATGDLSFEGLLNDKRGVLRTYADMWFYDPIVETHPSERSRSGPDVIHLGDRTQTWLLCTTTPMESIFRNEYLGFSGRYGGPVFSLHVYLDLRTVSGLQRFMRMARRELGLANEGSFAIHQGAAGWFGFGVENFITAVEAQESRYAELKWDRYHHSEELGFVDRLERGGLFGLSLRQSTGGDKNLYTSEVEVLLPGLPVDMDGIKRFCDLTRRTEEATLEIVNEDPVKTQHFTPRVQAEPVATIVSDSSGQQWVSGLVIKNPFYRKAVRLAESTSLDQPFSRLREQELLLCALRSWHKVDDRLPRYELLFAEGCWIAHYATFWIVCDWG